MQKIVILSIVALILLSATSTLVYSQDTNTLTGNQELTTGLKNPATNLTYVNNAIADYLSGKTKKFYVPGAVKEAGCDPSKYPVVPELGILSIQQAQVTPLTSQLTVKYTNDPHWANTYVTFGNGVHSSMSIDGTTSSLGTLQDYSNNQRYDELVMHFFAQNASRGNVSEHCIQMIRNGNTVEFHLIKNTNYNPFAVWTGPANDTYAMYMMAKNPSGKNFNQIEYNIYDVTTGRYYNTVQTTYADRMFQSDIALEKYYSIDGLDNEYPPTSIVWKNMRNVHVYDSTQHVFDLVQNGFVQELEVPTYTNPIVADYFYADFSDYFGCTNGQADNIYITRYNGQYSPPPHP